MIGPNSPAGHEARGDGSLLRTFGLDSRCGAPQVSPMDGFKALPAIPGTMGHVESESVLPG